MIITALAIAPALPDIARAAGVDTLPFVASVLAVSAAVTRVITVPAVHQLLARLLNDPAADAPADPPGRHRKDTPK